MVSNSIWRSEADYWGDFRAFNLAEFVHAIVSSVDTLWRKPHYRFYQAALQAAGVAPDRCTIVGNSESKDIAPAAALGMTTVRVALGEDCASSTHANFLCESLAEVVEVLPR